MGRGVGFLANQVPALRRGSVLRSTHISLNSLRLCVRHSEGSRRLLTLGLHELGALVNDFDLGIQVRILATKPNLAASLVDYVTLTHLHALSLLLQKVAVPELSLDAQFFARGLPVEILAVLAGPRSARSGALSAVHLAHWQVLRMVSVDVRCGPLVFLAQAKRLWLVVAAAFGQGPFVDERF